LVDLDLRQLMRIAQRRWWIVALLMIVAGTSAYISSSRETPMYSASATMLITPGLATTSTDYNALLTTQRLAETYQQIAMTQTMHDRVAKALGQEELTTGYSASAMEDSQIIQITATGPDPEQVARVANTVVDEFQQYISEQTAEQATTTRSRLDDQIAALEQAQSNIDEQIAELSASDNANDAAVQRQIDDLTSDRSDITQSIRELSTTAITLESQMAASNAQVQTLDPAQEPGAPFSPQPKRSLMLGLFVGALLGAGLVALLEFLDNTVKPDVNIQSLTGAPMLASVAQLPKLEPGGRQVYTMSQPQSSASESMRLLRTNLEFASASKPIHSITLTSPSPGEGKSTTAANLGVVMAQSGMTVALIDGDLRKPTLNRIFGVENDTGLTTLLTHPDASWETVARKVALPGLFLVPSGPIPPNPSDLVSSDRFERLIDSIKADVDMVIIDSSPVLSASDSLSISRHTDGVILVCQSHKTRIDALRVASHSIRQGGIRIIGVVLNRQKGQHGASYYGEYYGPATAPVAPSTAD
jgi:capsular exopolysaccharide synthesis family protein